MGHSIIVGKREFIQHTSKYLKWASEQNTELIITHQNKPDLILTKIKSKSIKDMAGFAKIKVIGDINDTVLPEINQWSS
jgi:hypothetical protein